LDLIEIFNKGMRNDICLGGHQGRKQRIKIYLFLVITVLLSRYRKIKEPTLVWINGNRGYEKNYTGENQYLVFHGTAFKRMSNYFSFNSVMSCQSFPERIRIFVRAVKIYYNSMEKIRLLPYWIEFSYICSLIQKSEVKNILTTSIYDRHITWISYLACEYHMEMKIYQHGVIGDETIEHKIICSKMYVLNESQIAIMKNNIVKNEDCEYEKKELKSVIEFAFYPDKRLPLIAIATQCNPKIIDGMTTALLQLDEEFCLILMLHPLEKKKAYRQYLQDKRVKIEPKNKYINLEILITQHSTIVYDYIQNDFKGKIIQMDPEGSICALDGVKEILRFNRFEDMAESVRELINIERKRG